MKVLLTGIGGFIGSHLAKAWRDAALDFVGVSRRKLSDNNEFEILYCDLANGMPYEKDVDIIVHTAAKSPSPGARIEEFVSSNIEGTRKLLEYAAKHGVSKFIYLSSVSVYGTVQVPIVDEKTPVTDPGIYGMTKLIGELLVKEAGLKSSMALRLPGVLGPGASTPWLCRVLEKLKNNLPVEYFNPYSPFNNLLHVDDLDMFYQLKICRTPQNLRLLPGRVNFLFLLIFFPCQASSSHHPYELDKCKKHYHIQHMF